MGQRDNVPGGNYAIAFDAGYAGLIADVRNKTVESFPSVDATDIAFGTGVVGAAAAASAGAVRAPRLNKSVLTVSTDLITSNSTIVTVNGNATTATVYASSHAATMEAISVKVRLLANVVSCVVAGDTLTIIMDDVDAVTTAVTTLGSSQPTWSAAYTSNDTIKGLTVYRPSEGTLPTQTTASVAVPYQDGDTVGVLKKGLVWAPIAATVADGESAYVITAASNRGKLTNVSTGNLLVGKFRLDLDTTGYGGTSGGLCLVEVNI